mgnify:CR=1 FL=1
MNKTLPFDRAQIEAIAQTYPTPFYLYDEQAIRQNARRLIKAFDWAPAFKEYFAVKATPNPYILKVLHEEGFGADCSSLPELLLAEKAGITGQEIMLTSNNTPVEEFAKALELGAILNLDDITHIAYLEEHLQLPKTISFRYNPGPLRGGNAIIGTPEEAKYGLTREQIFEAYRIMRDKGCETFGIHTMIISNELNVNYFAETAQMMFDLIVELHDELGITISFVDFGGGVGIPYRPEEEAVNLEKLGQLVKERYEATIAAKGLAPLTICLECGRVITGPYGYLVTQAIHRKDTYKHYIGVDACMANLMRPGMYGAYHHITVLGKDGAPLDHTYDVVGSLCENCDKFAIDRSLPAISTGDYLVIHDAGAHGHAMGFNYNGKLRSAELLLKADGTVQQIRRAETIDDLFATLDLSQL